MSDKLQFVVPRLTSTNFSLSDSESRYLIKALNNRMRGGWLTVISGSHAQQSLEASRSGGI
jgi:hypothetical protein